MGKIGESDFSGELGLDQPAADGIPHQAGRQVDVQFFPDAGAVRFGGLHPDAQAPRNFLGGLPLRDELQDLPFARRERVGRPYACSTSNVPVSSAFT